MRQLCQIIREVIREEHQRVQCYTFSSYWLDIGRHDDYERAAEKFEEDPSEFLPEE